MQARCPECLAFRSCSQVKRGSKLTLRVSRLPVSKSTMTCWVWRTLGGLFSLIQSRATSPGVGPSRAGGPWESKNNIQPLATKGKTRLYATPGSTSAAAQDPREVLWAGNPLNLAQPCPPPRCCGEPFRSAIVSLVDWNSRACLARSSPRFAVCITRWRPSKQAESEQSRCPHGRVFECSRIALSCVASSFTRSGCNAATLFLSPRSLARL